MGQESGRQKSENHPMGTAKTKRIYEESSKNLWDIIKHTSMHITRVTEEKKGGENLFEEMMTENFFNLRQVKPCP